MNYNDKEQMLISVYNIIYLFAHKYAKQLEMTFEDLVQELSTRLWKALDKFDSNKSRLTTFSYTVLKNECLMIYRSNQTRKELLNKISLDDEKYSIDMIEDEKLDTEEVYKLNYCSKILSLDSVLYDYFVSKLSQQELSRKYNISQAQMSRRIKNKLQEYSREYDN